MVGWQVYAVLSAVLSAASKAVPLYGRVGFTGAGRYGSYYVGKDRLRRLSV